MLPEKITRELRYLEIYTARRMRNLRAGTFTSRLRGPGFDFDQHRLYRAGDDVRRIDWNATARFQKPFVRETHAERELNLIVALDTSASMAFGTAGFDKQELMLYLAACLAFSAAADQINFGLLAFGSSVRQYWPPHRSRARAWRALDELWRLSADRGPTTIGSAADFLQKRLHQASVIFLVSDFLTGEALAEISSLRLLAARHDVIGIVVEDPAEARLFAAGGELRVRDPESGLRRHLAITTWTRRRYAAMTAERRAQLAESLFSAGLDHAFLMDRSPAILSPDETGAAVPVVEPLLELFSARRRA